MINYFLSFDNFCHWLAEQPQVVCSERTGLLCLRAEMLVLERRVGLRAELIPDITGDDTMLLELSPAPQWLLHFAEMQAARDSSCYALDLWSSAESEAMGTADDDCAESTGCAESSDDTGSRAAITDSLRLYLALTAESDMLHVETWLEQLHELEGPKFEPARIDIFAWLKQNA